MILNGRLIRFFVAASILLTLSLPSVRGTSATSLGSISALIGASGKLKAIFTLPGDPTLGPVAGTGEPGVYPLAGSGAASEAARTAIDPPAPGRLSTMTC